MVHIGARPWSCWRRRHLVSKRRATPAVCISAAKSTTHLCWWCCVTCATASGSTASALCSVSSSVRPGSLRRLQRALLRQQVPSTQKSTTPVLGRKSWTERSVFARCAYSTEAATLDSELDIQGYQDSAIFTSPWTFSRKPLFRTEVEDHHALFLAALQDGNLRAREHLLFYQKSTPPDITMHNKFLEMCLALEAGQEKSVHSKAEPSNPCVDRNQLFECFNKHCRYLLKHGPPPDAKTYALIVTAFLQQRLPQYSLVALNEATTVRGVSRGQVLEKLDAALRSQIIEGGISLPEPIEVDSVGIRDHKRSMAGHAINLTLADIFGDPHKVLVNKQEDLERRAMEETQLHFEKIASSYEKYIKASTSRNKKSAPLRNVMIDWHNKLTDRISAAIKQIEIPELKRLSCVPANHISLITIMKTIDAVTDRKPRSAQGKMRQFNMKTNPLCEDIGQIIENEAFKRLQRRDVISRRKALAEKAMHDVAISDSERRQHYAAMVPERVELERWDTATLLRVGSFFLAELIKVAKIPVIKSEKFERVAAWESFKKDNGGQSMQNTPSAAEEAETFLPVFHLMYSDRKFGNSFGYLGVESTFMEYLMVDPPDFRETRYLPMVIPPLPWLGFNTGGYLNSQVSLVRTRPGSEQYKLVMDACQCGNMDYVLNGLDALGRTPWRVNKRILEVVLKFWNSGEEFGSVPASCTANQVGAQLAPKPEGGSKKSLWEWYQKRNAAKRVFANSFSRRCDVNYKIQVAREFADDVIYFPHNLDFRGRAYPIPSHFNHLGNDLCRGLLMFAEKRELGERGFMWLKVHLANLFGQNKLSNDDRERWTIENIDRVERSAKDPFKEKWWMEAEDPWQALATCMEITSAIESRSPETFKSCIPVHQDGTCNGLQHYAALGGDVLGGKAVNLLPNEKPQDIYADVATLVEQAIKRDINGGDSELKELGLLLEGKVARKVVKQTVMTSVYGVTFLGARDQIVKRLEEIPELANCTHQEHLKMAMYLTRKTLASLGKMFTGARKIQIWLTGAASRISRAVTRELDFAGDESAMPSMDKLPMNGVTWITPLGLPIVQPYRDEQLLKVKTSLQTLAIPKPWVSAGVSLIRQRNAFPPNFIHSLDGTHMLMTAVACSREMVTFASVHDSFWTHAADVDKLGVILRAQFVKLHSGNILGKLVSDFREYFKHHVVPSRFAMEPPEVDGRLEELLNSPTTRAKSDEAPSSLFDPSPEMAPDVEDEATVYASKTRTAKKWKKPTKKEDVFVPVVFPDPPKRGELDVEDVTNSQYFFH